MNKLITLDEAFTGRNWEIVKREFKALNREGVCDKNFQTHAEPAITTAEAWNNFLAWFSPPVSSNTVDYTRITFQ
jgi:hypothetical protein